MSKTYVGSRVRQLRNERGFSQAALAQMLEISPSYLNQIEHDVRPLTVAVLLRITEVFGVDATFFASQDDTRLVAELREVTLDRDLDIAIDPHEVAEMVSAHPGLARAVVNLHRRYRITTAQLAAATEERFSDGSGRGSITMPHEEVRDYFYQRQNYLHALDTAAEDLTAQMRMHHGDLARELTRRLTEVHGVRINKRIDLGDTVLHRYDPATNTLEISSHLSPGQQVFKMAAELAYLEFGDLIDAMVTDGKFTSAESRTLARLGLANYFAAATVLPYRQFHDVAENFRYDVERLSAFYSVSYETIAHRLSTLQRPSMRGVPFTFVRVDRAGNMSKRQSATGFHFSSSGGTCPLWNVYETPQHGVPVSGETTMTGQNGQVARISPGKFRQLGPVNWLVAKLAARAVGAPQMHLFTTLGYRQYLFWTFAIYTGRLLHGRLPGVDTELVILRVAHLRSCEYELQHHRRMARRRGLDANTQATIFAWPDVPDGDGPRKVLSARQQALLQATDELIKDRTITAGTWERLATHLDPRLLIEFCLLATQYDAIAATITALAIPPDNPQ